MKKSFTLLGLWILGFQAHAQMTRDTLQAFGAPGNLYFYHTVQKGETFYSLGRSFLVSPFAVARINDLTFDSTIKVFQWIRIPLQKTNFSQQINTYMDSGFLPVYHRVLPQETLFGIGRTFHDVPLQNLKVWNHLSHDQVDLGQFLIIGWVKSNIPVVKGGPISAFKSFAGPKTLRISVPLNVSRAVLHSPSKTQEDNSFQTELSRVTGESASQGPASIPSSKRIEDSTTEKVIPPMMGTDLFEQVYMEQTDHGKHVSQERGAAGWFKSNITPGSKKYYALNNEVPRGTIIKVTNPMNGRFVFVKILDRIPLSETNGNIIVKISSAAMGDLGIRDPRFFCAITYPAQKDWVQKEQ
ncbi:MAG: DPBB and LysM peptidoglycan-binding domain-containing protein [Chitinophagaceae bacterium]